MVNTINRSSNIKESESEIINLVDKKSSSNINAFAEGIDSIFGTIKGSVKDSLGNSLVGALVKIMSLIYEPKLHNTTDATGEYKISNVQPGVYKIYAIYQGKILQEGQTITVAPSQEVEKDFVLQDDQDMKLALIAGDVFDGNSKDAIKKASIKLFSVKNNSENLIAITNSNDYGQFTFRDLNMGKYNIIISATGYFTISISVNAITEGQIIPIKLYLLKDNSEGTVSGIIKDDRENPIKNCDVILYRVEENDSLTPVSFTKTNSEGVYLFQKAPLATYKIKANENRTIKIYSPNSPSYYKFSIAKASVLDDLVMFVEDDANIFNGAIYEFNKEFVSHLGGTNRGEMIINITALFSAYYDVSISYLSGYLDSTIIMQADPDNNGKQTTVTFPKTNGWSLKDVKIMTINLPLYAGINRFRIFNDVISTSPWIGDFSIVYTKNSYNANMANGIVSSGAIYLSPFATNLGGPSKGEVTIPIDIPFSQVYDLQFEYLSGDTSRPLKIDIDGVNQASVNVPKTNDWSIGSAKTYDIKIKAEQGLRYFKFYNDTGDYAPNVGNLIFNDCIVSKDFFPKDVILLDGANIKNDIINGPYVDGIVHGKGKVEFSVNVFEDELYDFQILYKCNDDRTCNVKVNDSPVLYEDFIFLATGNSLGVFNTRLFFTKGVNKITIYNA